MITEILTIAFGVIFTGEILVAYNKGMNQL